MITSTRLRKLWKQRPFSPFRIVTNSGQQYDILGPEFLMVTKSMLAIGGLKNKDDAEFDSVHVVGVAQVATIESLESQAKKR